MQIIMSEEDGLPLGLNFKRSHMTSLDPFIYE